MSAPDMHSSHRDAGFIAAITSAFVDSKLVPIIILAMLLMGGFAIINTPSEEEPQIVVPMIDIFVQMPGAPPREIEKRVVSPLEKLLWEIPGVEYVYSTALDGHALSIVRFYVGEDTEKSLIKTYTKLYQHLDWIPAGCSMPLLKPRSIDDVPIIGLTFWGDGYNSQMLRTIVTHVDDEIRNIPGISETFVQGCARRQAQIFLKPDKISALGLDPVEIAQAIQEQNRSERTGEFSSDNYSYQVRLNNFFKTIKDVENTVIKVAAGKPVFLRDVASITDGPEEPESYVLFGAGAAAHRKSIAAEPGNLYPALTIAAAKRKGLNATHLANAVLKK